MNILSHYYLDRDHPSDYYKFGLIFPELFKHFNQLLRKSITDHGPFSDKNHQEIAAGIQRHYALDKIFHSSDFFDHFSGLAKQKLLEAPLPTLHYRTFFLAHIFVEMLLDRLLIKQNRQVATNFYTSLKAIDRREIRSFFEEIGQSTVANEFFKRFDGFVQYEYLYHYADNERFIYALLRVYGQANPAVVGETEKNTLSYVTEAFENTYSKEMWGIFDEMKMKLNSTG